MDRSFLDPSLEFYVSEEFQSFRLEGALLTSTTIYYHHVRWLIDL